MADDDGVLTGPLEIAYAALAQRIAAALVSAGFIAAPAGLRIDPTETLETDPDSQQLETAAGLVRVSTAVARTVLGRGSPRYLVHLVARLELAAVCPSRDVRRKAIAAASDALAPLTDLDPTLSGACERAWISEQSDDAIDPNGEELLIAWTIRVRSSDRLGRSF